MSEELNIRIEKKDGPPAIIIFYLEGYLQANTLQIFKDNVQIAFNEGIYNIIFHCEEIKFISSAALGSLMSFLDEVEDNNGKIVMVSLSAPMVDVFEILEFYDVFPVTDSVEQALEKFSEKE